MKEERRTPGEAGFALLVTLLLLALLVLLLTSLASLAGLDRQAAEVGRQQAQARRSALLALDLALGELQRTAGPDQRVTTIADGLGETNRHYTGVWDATDDRKTPLTWLVGTQSGDPDPMASSTDVSQRVVLVRGKSPGEADDVMVPKCSLQTAVWPGWKGLATIGHYAWWVGDEGVKAPVGLADRSAAIDYSPYDSPERRRRWWQQAGSRPAAMEFDLSDGVNDFDPDSLIAFNQLSWVRDHSGAPLGSAILRKNSHTWSLDNLAVLADSHRGGLRRDLSLVPETLGEAFAHWTRYTEYMEAAGTPFAPAPLPGYSADPVRRRYRMTSAITTEGGSHGVWPALSYFLLSFNVRTQGGSSAVKPIEVRARWMMTLWNPYTSALVPEDLRLEISGLPNAVQVVDDTAGGTVATISLGAAFGSPLRISLPWDSASGSEPGRKSWLPGRVHTWTALENLSGTKPVNGYASRFDSRNLSADAGQGVQQVVGGTTVDGDHACHLSVAATQALTIRLFAVGSGRDAPLAVFRAPEFAGFATTPRKLSSGTYQFSYLFRLAESFDTPLAPNAWISQPGCDPRSTALGPDAFVTGPDGNRPELYENYTTISAPDRLWDRAGNALSYNEDVPLFELPRAPLLSLGELQHFHLEGVRPFAVGNSWGADCWLNGFPALSLFDRFFFSGLAPGVMPPSGRPLPNPQLQFAARQADGSPWSADDLRERSASGWSAKYVLQGGAFNLNSVNVGAWRAVLSGLRFSEAHPFTYLNVASGTGSAGDDSVQTVVPSEAQFFRFPQSAEETWKADDPVGSSTYAASTVAPPLAPNNPSAARTHLFRRGFRSLDSTQVRRLAEEIVALNRVKQAASGPWRSLEEFLGPSALFSQGSDQTPSLLEKAIAAAGLNDEVGEFSSQWLTQADLMTTLAPGLFARSDTFVIRTYGDACNPVTGTIGSRVWSEAFVQREPEYFDASEAAEKPSSELNPANARFGRRFRIVSFRWLTSADL
jgi:type II secretory pathway pseudopilin PulG